MKNEKLIGSGVIQFIKFGIVGVSNTAVDWMIFFILTSFVMIAKDTEPIAKTIAFAVAVINSFIWNSIWTFRSEYKQSTKGEDSSKKTSIIFFRFFIVSLIGWGVNYFAFKYARFDLDQGKIVALIAASGAAILWNFFANKLWTYKPPSLAGFQQEAGQKPQISKSSDQQTES